MPHFQETLLSDERGPRKAVLSCVLFTWTTAEIRLERGLVTTWTSRCRREHGYALQRPAACRYLNFEMIPFST